MTTPLSAGLRLTLASAVVLLATGFVVGQPRHGRPGGSSIIGTRPNPGLIFGRPTSFSPRSGHGGMSPGGIVGGGTMGSSGTLIIDTWNCPACTRVVGLGIRAPSLANCCDSTYINGKSLGVPDGKAATVPTTITPNPAPSTPLTKATPETGTTATTPGTWPPIIAATPTPAPATTPASTTTAPKPTGSKGSGQTALGIGIVLVGLVLLGGVLVLLIQNQQGGGATKRRRVTRVSRTSAM